MMNGLFVWSCSSVVFSISAASDKLMNCANNALHVLYKHHYHTYVLYKK